MQSDSATGRSVEVVSQMLQEQRHPEACLFLFHLNKLHPEEWQRVCSLLLESIDSPNDLLRLATLIKCSARSDLSSCDALIPGLSQYSRRHMSREILD